VNPGFHEDIGVTFESHVLLNKWAACDRLVVSSRGGDTGSSSSRFASKPKELKQVASILQAARRTTTNITS
jgi:hypothetical protein